MSDKTTPPFLEAGYYLAPAAFLMVAFISWVLTRAVKARSGIDVVIVLLLLATMVAMLAGPAYLYLTTLGFGISDVVIWEIAVFMSGGMMPIFGLTAAGFIYSTEPGRRGAPPLASLLEHATALRAGYIVLLVVAEFLMGWTFNLASGLMGLSAGYTLVEVAGELQASLTSYWFVFTMVGEMAFTLFALRKVLRRRLLRVLAVQAAIMFLTPTALNSRAWETYSFYLEAALMIALVAYAFRFLRGSSDRDRPVLIYLGLFIVANAAMMAGLLAWFVSGDSLLLALSLLAQTAIYFDAVFTGAGIGETFHP